MNDILPSACVAIFRAGIGVIAVAPDRDQIRNRPNMRFLIPAGVGKHKAVLFATFGPAVAGRISADARSAATETQQTVRLILLLQNHALRSLMPEHLAALRTRFHLT